MNTYNIFKSYDSKPSQNKMDERALLLADAIFQLDVNESLWRKNGGSIVERGDMHLTVAESNGSEVITWTIQENEDS